MFDPFGMHNQINQMMSGFMMDPFGNPSQMNNSRGNNNNNNSRNNNNNNNNNQLSLRNNMFDPFAMSPFDQHHQMMRHDPFSMMNNMMSQMHSGFPRGGGGITHFQSTDPNAQVFSSSSVITYSNSGDGKPKVYQQSSQVRQGPGGVRETRNLVRDSEKGLEKVSIGHHIGDRAHIIERQKVKDGELEEIVNLENLDEEEVPHFNHEFESKIASRSRDFNNHGHRSHHHLNNNQPLAIEDITHQRTKRGEQHHHSNSKSERKSKSKPKQ